MRLKTMALSLAAGLALGCSSPMYFYPVKGPLAALGSVPVLKGTYTGGGPAIVRLQLPDGENCRGDWSAVKPETLPGNLAGRVAAGSLSAAWDAVYGPGFYLARVLGSERHGQALLKGDRGTTLSFEAYWDTIKDSPMQGVALDSQGNLYKVTQ